MRIVGKEYPSKGTNSKKNGIYRLRAIYEIEGSSPTPEQLVAIDRLERGLHGEWYGDDHYNEMIRAENVGITLGEEELCPDGIWREVQVD